MCSASVHLGLAEDAHFPDSLGSYDLDGFLTADSRQSCNVMTGPWLIRKSGFSIGDACLAHRCYLGVEIY